MRQLAKIVAVTCAVASAFGATFAMAVQARSTPSPGAALDQSYPRPAAPTGAFNGAEVCGGTGQSFTDQVTGKLTDITVWLSASPFGGTYRGPYTANVTAVLPNGDPDPNTVLSSVQFSLPAGASAFSYTPVDITFTSPVDVVAGQHTAFVLVQPSCASADPTAFDEGGAYPGTYAGGQAWGPFISPGTDIFFQTYVIPSQPTPTTTTSPTSSKHAITGTAKADTITGTAGADVIRAGAGNDTIHGGSGNDIIYGGSGADRIYGGSGNDIIYAVDHTKDMIDCGTGRDTVYADKIDAVGKNCEVVHRI